MRRFIFGERGGIHIIDLQKTERLLKQAQDFAGELAGRGGHHPLRRARRSRPATPSRRPPPPAGMPYVDQRWLGGLLTNFQTISKRIKRLHELRDWTESGTMELLPVRERIARHVRARQARDEPRRRGRHAAAAGRDVRGGHEVRGDRRARGHPPEDPDHRAGGHQLQPRPGGLRDPRATTTRSAPARSSSRRSPTWRPTRRPSSAPRRSRRAREREEAERREAEEQARREAEEAERREAEERARREAEEAGFSPDEPATPAPAGAAPRERRTFDPDEEG